MRTFFALAILLGGAAAAGKATLDSECKPVARGMFKAGAVVAGKKNGCFECYRRGTHQLQSWACYKDDREDGPVVIYGSGGNVLIDGHSKAGQPEGLQRHFFANGNVDTEYTLVGGRKNGVEKIFQSNGTIHSVHNFVDDKFSGDQIDYNYDGSVNKRGHYEDGIVDGVVEQFSSNGKLLRHSEFSHGQPHGWQRRYASDGVTMLDEQCWKQGKLIATSALDGGVTHTCDAAMANSSSHDNK